MIARNRFSQFGLVQLLLLVTVAELALNRLAVPALRPPGDIEPPLWHQIIDHFGLFFFYFATTLAISVLAHRLWLFLREPEHGWAPIRYLLAAIGLGFLLLAIFHVSTTASEEMSFTFNSCFTALLIAVLAIQISRHGDFGAKFGILFLIIPLVVHYYTPFALRFIESEDALWGDLPLQMQDYGKWSIVFAAMLSPYCFAPRPFLRSAISLPPLAIGAFVGLLGAIILRQHYEVGMVLASRGLGVDIGPGAPTHHIALFLMALGAIAWTLSSCLVAATPSRRNIGVGIGLVVVGGYGFAWPLQYLVSMVGLLTISSAARSVVREEREAEANVTVTSGFRPPPISDEAWQLYTTAVVAALREAAPESSSVTVRGEDGLATTHIVTRLHDLAVRLRVERADDSILGVEIRCGEDPGIIEPNWTLFARPERLLGVKTHPEPPLTTAPGIKTGDHSFDLRFRVRDADELTAALLDDGLRARATALVDGWIAYWDKSCLIYRVHPGRGAPLDHPIPITELAFRGSNAPPAVDRLLTLIDLLATMGHRVLPPSSPPSFLDSQPPPTEPGANAANDAANDAASDNV